MNISVFITSYNQKGYLVEAIESVLAQTLPPQQLIIVDDASGDGSQGVIAGYQRRFPELIIPIYHEQNQGVVAARRSALAAATGELVTYLDGDDRFLPTKLEKEAGLWRQGKAEIVFSNSFYITAVGERTHTWITNRLPPQGDVFVPTLTRQFPRGNLFRMELLPLAAWRAVGFHDPALPVLEDWEMRVRLTKRYRVAYWDEPLSEIRVHTAGLSSVRVGRKLTAVDYIWQKSEPLLVDLPLATQQQVARRMVGLRAQFVRQQAKELLGAYGGQPGSRREAWEIYRASWRDVFVWDTDLVLGLVLPYPLYRRLRQRVRAKLVRGDGRSW